LPVSINHNKKKTPKPKERDEIYKKAKSKNVFWQSDGIISCRSLKKFVTNSENL